ncbi:GNAT family N-acetyltransferase [Acidaminobacter sp. JC074]|uniref:GNAT family N-acetyltransferase n=1 Tax=Acidaminobacter sp. JC074 TaxID=2530199 RepID=UPI001F10DBB8|nr:GNAT family N-acetyltransferase [Acidaminobacter sp. JC074]MCH4886243.1 GNAT family N-acetyltransferase [Acidaminobacter sp. JC074]
MDYRIEKINESNKHYHNKAVEAFEVFGKLEIRYDEHGWHTKEKLLDKPYLKLYDAFQAECEDYLSNPDQTIFYALNDHEVLGQIVIRKNWNKYCYIDDIAVSKKARQKGVATRLLDQAQKWALENKLGGFMLETQDINLAACRFYKKNGFVIGSIDNMLYRHFDTKDEIAMIWYKEF